MKFLEAMKALSEGKKVRAKNWESVYYLESTDGKALLPHNISDCFYVYANEDWEIYEEPKEKKRYWIWSFRTNNLWWKAGNYYDERGAQTNGSMYSPGWGCMEKIKHENEFIEV